jgi:NTP pyrophosphatase (non-canonical NTP hydrolase)
MLKMPELPHITIERLDDGYAIVAEMSQGRKWRIERLDDGYAIVAEMSQGRKWRRGGIGEQKESYEVADDLQEMIRTEVEQGKGDVVRVLDEWQDGGDARRPRPPRVVGVGQEKTNTETNTEEDEIPAMSFRLYQKLTLRTINMALNREQRLAMLCLGLTGEAGETVDHFKKNLYHGHDLDLVKVKKELGDVLYYTAALAESLGLSLTEIAAENIEKLRIRYKDGFSFEASKVRVDVKK